MQIKVDMNCDYLYIYIRFQLNASVYESRGK